MNAPTLDYETPDPAATRNRLWRGFASTMQFVCGFLMGTGVLVAMGIVASYLDPNTRRELDFLVVLLPLTIVVTGALLMESRKALGLGLALSVPCSCITVAISFLDGLNMDFKG